MQLGKAIIGALIGAALSIVLLLVVYLTLGIDKVWMAIPFAIITGLGVRTFVSTSGHASYARGAITALLALAAYIGGWWLVAQVATARANSVPRPDVTAEALEQPAGDKGEAGEAQPPDSEPKAEAAPKSRPQVVVRGTDQGMLRAAGPREFSTWDFICLVIAAFVAYELGRGTGGVAARSVPPSGPMPAGTHPDA